MSTLAAKKRSILGKKVKILRTKGYLPAVVYGSGDEGMSISVPLADFIKLWQKVGESSMLELDIESSGKKNVLIHDVALDPIKDIPIHVDFFEARSDRLTKVKMPLVFEGESEAIKTLGGVLIKIIHEVEIEAFPQDLPHEIKVDISKLKTFKDSIFIREIKLPKGVAILGDGEAVVAKVEPPRSEEEIAGAEKPEISLDDIKVVPKGKEKEEPEISEEPVE